MANLDAAAGLIPVRYLNGAPYNGQANTYIHLAASTAPIFIGMGVTLAATGSDATGKYASVIPGTVTSSVFVGVCVGVHPVDRDSLVYSPGSADRLIFVADDPQLVFQIQEVSDGTPLTAAEAGLNANLVQTATGSTTTGLCGWELNNVGEVVTATLDVKILNVSNVIDNDLGEHCNWDVRINRHQYVNQLAGI